MIATPPAWQCTQHPRIQVAKVDDAWVARHEDPIPDTRIRCGVCRKNLVPKKDGSAPKHRCEASPDRAWNLIKKGRKLKRYVTMGMAYAVALERAGIAPRQGSLFT
jgi:hypothetical protein